VATTLDAQGRIKQLAEFQQLVYGERNGEMSGRVKALDAAMQGPASPRARSGTILQEMWEKWIPAGHARLHHLLLRGTVGDIEAAPGGAALALEVLAECVRSRLGPAIRRVRRSLERTQASVTGEGSPSAPSMYRDLTQGLPVERIRSLAICWRGAAVRHRGPILSAAYAHLSIYLRRIAAA